MAARLLSARNVRIPVAETLCEFDEEDVWNMHALASEINGKQDYKSPIKFSSRGGKRSAVTPRMIPARIGGEKSSSSSSAPVNIPDWPKILREEFRANGGGLEFEHEDGDFDGGESMVPPHELLARVQMASFSVHEGVGRALKGRGISVGFAMPYGRKPDSKIDFFPSNYRLDHSGKGNFR